MKLQLGYVVIFCLLLLKKWFGLPGLGGIVLNGLKWVILDITRVVWVYLYIVYFTF